MRIQPIDRTRKAGRLRGWQLWLPAGALVLALAALAGWRAGLAQTQRGAGAQDAGKSVQSAQVSAPEPKPEIQPSEKGQAGEERKKQIADESASLLSLANSLKAEVDKTTKDTLSVTVVRKADEIERLAHKMRTQ